MLCRKDHACHFDRSDAKRREVEKSGHEANKADFSTPSVPSKVGPDSARSDILKFFSTKQFKKTMAATYQSKEFSYVIVSISPVTEFQQ
jgi:hypothetical protein